MNVKKQRESRSQKNMVNFEVGGEKDITVDVAKEIEKKWKFILLEGLDLPV